ncbi:MAG: DNA polymerase I [Planctomycetota bacterium]
MSDSASPHPHPTLYLIDGHAQMYRSFFAIRGGMTSPVTGEPTNACFAFTAMFIKLFEQFNPPYAAMAIDAADTSFRNDLYPEYKANRDKTPDDLKAQIPRMLEIARGFGLPILGDPKAEADDILATLATQHTTDAPHDTPGDLHVRLVSKDKDLEQVLSPRISLFDIHTDTELDVPALLEKKGITPAQAIDYQTLIGDSTDNVPGVQGIGPKTAAKLIQQFGSVQAIVDNIDQLKGKQKERLQEAIDTGQLELTRQLVTLDQAVEIEFDLADAKVSPDQIDTKGLTELFKELGFNRHITDLQRITQATPAPAKKAAKPEQDPAGFGLFAAANDDEAGADAEAELPLPDGDYTAIKTRDELDALVTTLRQQDLIAVDTETIGLGHRSELCGICLAWQPEAGVYLPIQSPEPDSHLDWPTIRDALRPVFEDASVAKSGHNIKYDLLVLRHAGLDLKGVAFDSMVGAFLAGTPGIGMDELARSELGYACMPITSLIGPKPTRKADPPQKTMDQVPLDRVTAYAAEDADITLRLTQLLQPRLKKLGMADLVADVEMPLVDVLATMERHGIRVDPAVLDKQRADLEARVDQLRSQILDAAKADFNPDSTKQLADVLFNQLNFPKLKKTKTGYSTNSEVLEKLTDLSDEQASKVPEHAHPIPELVLEYRSLTKLVGTYLGNLKDAIWLQADGGDDRVHASFHQTGAATGRLSSSNPNLQNIPIRTDVGRQIRRAFVAEPGHRLVAADYSQIELRMLAHLAEDEALIAAFKADQDIHTAVAAAVFDLSPDEVSSAQRGHAKMINFGIIYGITPYGLARRVESLDNDTAKQLIDDYKARYAGIDRFMGQCVQQAAEEGHVTTILGRRRVIPDIHSSNGQKRALAERLAINSVVQGSAADLIKKAMVDLHRRIADASLPMKMLLQIHDELVVEAPEDQAEAMADVLAETMESAMSLDVPLKVDTGIGVDWYHAK